MSENSARRTPRLSSYVSVGLWRSLATGEESDDIVIFCQRDGMLCRLRLSEADAQSLADSIAALRATSAVRRVRRSTKDFAGAQDAAGAELPTSGDDAAREEARC